MAFTLPALVGVLIGAAVFPAGSAVAAGGRGTAAVGVVTAGLAPALRYRGHRWEVTEVAVYTRRG